MPPVFIVVCNNTNVSKLVDGEQREYYPDFLARIDDGNGEDDLLNVLPEVTVVTAGSSFGSIVCTRGRNVSAGTSASDRYRAEHVQ